MKARIAASVVLAVGVALATAGCNLVAPQATRNLYDPSDGVGATIGDLALRNAFIVSDDGELGTLVVTVVNSGDETQTLEVQYESTTGRTDAEVSAVPGNTEVGPQKDASVTMSDLDTIPGSLLPVYFQYGSEEGKELLVPVLTSALESYATLTPAPSATPTQTATPDPANTALPTPTTEPGNSIEPSNE
ncbi:MULTISPECIES: hypothetical protein [unclassified Rathayibacter]|uniref:hypothetical protein n=1 Tax=unclassified Rathayibacter TaxID=2609250 RepID=UPI0006F24467|nr:MULTISPECIES: hypothetical protein [unclassified Rathayibacter]KQQ05117.1 hypothetical protein ASF42_00375 [Rathayibacter sp. Leaf294]KQS12980.1 hypothetical protein ASG06_00375 [Rathayibacter sp. Leaf185]